MWTSHERLKPLENVKTLFLSLLFYCILIIAVNYKADLILLNVLKTYSPQLSIKKKSSLMSQDEG